MKKTVAIFGQGYVGLPLARATTLAGFRVIGVDANSEIVASLNAGHSHIDDIPDPLIREMLRLGFYATAAVNDPVRPDISVICVPTPLNFDRTPDLSAVKHATEAAARVLRPRALVVLESTTYPGTTEDIVRPILESTGLIAGRDFHLAYSPERIDPGNTKYNLYNTPKVVGGLTEECARKAALFYGTFVKQVVVSRGTREAEMTKLLENTYRHVNIALVNELASICYESGIDIWDVVDAAATKPFGFESFKPGPGVGGHCIPVDPGYLACSVRESLGRPFRIIETAEEINRSAPHFVEERVKTMLRSMGKNLSESTVLLLGVSYKPNIADTREAPAYVIGEGLIASGISVAYHDPRVPQWTISATVLSSVSNLVDAVRMADAIVLLQPHAEYDVPFLASNSRAFLDTRGVAERSVSVERL